jgi:hypothetical protein
MIPDNFNCIRMKRAGAEVILKETAGMTLEQRIDYWVKKNQEFLKWHEELRKGRQRPTQ